jgi:hypothetical protein
MCNIGALTYDFDLTKNTTIWENQSTTTSAGEAAQRESVSR